MRNRPVRSLALLTPLALVLATGCEPQHAVDPEDEAAVTGDDDAAVPVDLDGDGQPDAFDTDGDGVADAIDSDGDGQPDAFDTDGDGELDDWNGDGVPDPVPPGVDDGDLANEDSDADGYCFDPEGGWFACDDGAPPGSGAPDTPQLGDPGLGGPPPGDDDDDDDGPGSGNDGEVCDDEVFQASEAVPPRILLVVDKSGSMEDGAVGYPGSKWDGAVDALSSVVTSLSGDVEFGLMLYPDGDANSNVCRAGSVDVSISSTSAFSIVDELDGAWPGGGTPTAATLQRAKQTLDGLPAAGGSRVVVLATDGGPGCNENLDADTCTCVTGGQCSNALNCLDDDNTIAAAASLNAAGYSVFVIGIPGSENFSDVLDDLAAAGGTAQPGATGFYQANDADALATSLENIASRVATCRFDLSAPVSDAADVSVTVGSAGVPRDPSRTNGWDLVDSDTIELFGPACDGLLGTPANVQVGYCYAASDITG